jgi:hypothetical protein
LLYILCFTKLTNNNSFRNWLEHLSPDLTEIEFGHFEMFVQVSWSLITALYLTSGRENTTLRRWLTVASIAIMVRDNEVISLTGDTTLYQLRWKFVAILKGSLLLCWRTHNKTSIYSEMLEAQDSQNEVSSKESRISSHMRFANRKRLS